MEKLDSLWRTDTTTLPDIPLPIYPRAVGHFMREGNQVEYNPKGREFVELYWCIKGEGEVVIKGRKYPFNQEEVFFYLPHEPHNLRATDTPWEYRWISFDGPGAADFILSYKFPRKVFHAGTCPENLFQEQKNLLQEMSQFAWREMVANICRILARVGGVTDDATSKGRVVKEIICTCKNRFKDSNLDVSSIADQVGMSRSSILRIFRKEMGLAPSEYLMRLRLQNAVSLLVDPKNTFKEVAFNSGFADPAYFSRLIRKKYKMSPSELRKNLNHGDNYIF